LRIKLIFIFASILFTFKPVIGQNEVLNALIDNVLSKSEFLKQQDRHIAINDSIYKTGDFKLEFGYLNQLIDKCELTNNGNLKGNVLISKGNLYLEIGSHFKGIECFQEAIDYYQKTKNYSGLNTSYSNMGNAYYYLGNLDKALYYYKIGINDYMKITEKKPSLETKLANLYNAIGVVYCSKMDFVYGKVYFDLSLGLWEKLKDTLSIAYVYNNYALIYLQTKKIDSALKYFNLAKELKVKFGYRSDIIDAYNNLSDFHSQTNNLSKALDFVKMAYSHIDTSIYNTDLLNTYTNFTNVYRLLKDPKNELLYLKLKNKVKDSLNVQSQQEEISKLELKADFEKIHLADSIRSHDELQIKDLKISEKRKESVLLIILLILTIIALGLIYSRFNTTKKQKLLIEQQKTIVDVKNKEITDSINYAKRLQDAILPADKLFKETFQEQFVIYHPKDIVSGDFYFYEKKGNTVYIAAADCTGHGVPGAMLSIACYNALQKAIFEKNLVSPGEILDGVKNIITEHFNKTGNNISDGMDISLLAINYESQMIEWAGANNRLFYIQNNALHELKPDRQPVGKSDSEKPFTTQDIPFVKGTLFYLFTDGIIDQFGGDNIKKYTVSKFRTLLDGLKSENLTVQNQEISKVLLVWKGNNEQTDDVTVLGVRI